MIDNPPNIITNTTPKLASLLLTIFSNDQSLNDTTPIIGNTRIKSAIQSSMPDFKKSLIITLIEGREGKWTFPTK